MDIDGGNVRLVAKEREGFYSLECTPDGQWLLYQTTPAEIRRVRLDGTSATPLTVKLTTESAVSRYALSTALAVSGDGTRIAGLCMDFRRQKLAIYVIPAQGGEPERTYDVPAWTATNRPSLRWTPDGRALSYIATTAETSNIWIQPIAGGPPRQLTNFAEGLIWAHAWAADGRLALARGRVNQDIVLITSESRK